MKEYKLNKKEKYFLWFGLIVGIIAISTINHFLSFSKYDIWGLRGFNAIWICASLLGLVILYIKRDEVLNRVN